MNGYLLDTDIVIEVLRKNPTVLARMAVAESTLLPMAIHALTYYETRRGLIRIQASQQLREFETLCEEITILHTSRSALDIASQIYANLASQGQIIGDADILISAAALTNNLVVVTHNLNHFGRIPSLTIEDWTVALP